MKFPLGLFAQIFFVTTLNLFFSVSSFAQFNTGVIASAVGGAGRAAVDPSEATFLNPAGLSHVDKYYANGSITAGEHPRTGTFMQYAAVLTDGNEMAMFPGALSYVYRVTEAPGQALVKQHDIQAAASVFVAQGWSVGASGHRLSFSQAGSADYDQYNGGIGTLYVPVPWFAVGLVGYDLFPAAESVPVGIQVVPTYALGVHGMYENLFRVRADVVRPDKHNPGMRQNVGIGAEMYFRQDFVARMGYQWQETQNKALWTTGIGFKGPRLSADYTFEKDTRSAGGIRHMFDLWLPFW